MKATIIINTNVFGGFYDIDQVPSNKEIVSDAFDYSLFINPIWFNNEWVEGATTEQLEQQTQNKKSEYLNKLVTLVNKLDKRILISSVSKEESDIEYLKNQTENRYLQKYKVAKKYVDTLGLYTPILEDADWYNQIVAELENTNTIQNQNIPLSYFMNLIVQYYELGDFRNMKFQTALETFRAKTKDYILMLNFVKADECMELAETLPDAMSLEDLDNKIIELNAI